MGGAVILLLFRSGVTPPPTPPATPTVVSSPAVATAQPTVPLVDDDTLKAVRAIWLVAAIPASAALADEDTLEAVRNLWNGS